MRAYAYVAYTAEGKRRTGSVVAQSDRAAMDLLTGRGLFPSEVVAETTPTAPGSSGQARRAVKRLELEERAIFARQMSVLLAASLSREAALDAIMQSEGSARMHGFAARLKAGVLEGMSISELLDAAPSGFPRYCIASIRAGEASGRLAEVFERLADHFETQDSQKSRIATALVYPAFVALVSLLVCAVLVTQVAPELRLMFDSANRPLPDLTRLVLSISDGLTQNWMLSLGVTFGLVAGAVMVWRAPGPRDVVLTRMLRLPLIGRQLRLSICAQYLRTLALVLGSKQTVLVAVGSAAEVVTIESVRAQADAVVADVTQGASLTSALDRLTLLPAVVRQMIRVGEETAGIDKMADRAAMVLEGWLDTERKRLAGVLDPLLMMVIGVFVLTVVLAVLLPIFELQSVVAG